MPEHIVVAWESYFATKDIEAKNILIGHYGFLVKNIMRPFWAKKPFLLEMDDLYQSGTLGLMQALERYQKDSDATFETFAQLRIKGAMLDEINSLDWTPRNIRKNIRDVIEAETRLVAQGKEANNLTISELVDLTPEQVAFARASAQRTFIIPVDQDSIREMEYSLQGTANDTALTDSLDGSAHGSDGLEFRISMMRELNPEERQVIYLRFFYGESMKHISKILGIPTSKVSVIHKRAIEKLRIVFGNSHVPE